MSRFVLTAVDAASVSICWARACLSLKYSDTKSVQVEVLTSQNASLEQQLDAVPTLRRQLHTANSQHEECEMKLHDMIEENKGIQEQVRGPLHDLILLLQDRELVELHFRGPGCDPHGIVQVTKLQQEVKRIRTESARRGKPKQENREVLQQVENLQSELNAAHGGQEEMRMKAHAMDRKLEAAASREAKLKTELQCARDKADNLQMEVQKQESKVSPPPNLSMTCEVHILRHM
jgi:DNA repair exonuclease SbcCD ATPase subunit